MAMAKVTRAIYSERQLQQVMDDFWFNHFNVFAGKGEDEVVPDFLRTRCDPAAHFGQSSKICLPRPPKAPRCFFISIIF